MPELSRNGRNGACIISVPIQFRYDMSYITGSSQVEIHIDMLAYFEHRVFGSSGCNFGGTIFKYI